MSKNTILVTGRAEYKGYKLVILDNLINGHKYVLKAVLRAKLIVEDISDRIWLDRIFAQYNIIALMQFAVYAYLGELISHAWQWHLQQ